MTFAFRASGVAIHPDADGVLQRICARLHEHVTVIAKANGARLETSVGAIDMMLSSGCLNVDVQCQTACALFSIRSMVAEQLFMAAGDEAPQLRWEDGPQASAIPDFREITVVGARMITPLMRRITVATANVEHFLEGGLHARLLIPPRGRDPVWPHTEPNGRIHWPKGDDALTIRAYTIRNVDLTRGELDIDFVIHEGDNVPGAAWALSARAGDRAGLMGPGGGGMPEAENLYLAGDETALPAIARIAAAASATTSLRIVLEVAEKAEEQHLASAARCDVTWLHRNGRKPGTTGMLVDATCDIAGKAVRPEYIWVACEQEEARRIRNFMRTESGYDRKYFSVAAYWQRH